MAFLEPNVLLFDEPTNHLDMEMRQALANAMNAFPGAILLISHDRFLLKSTVEQFVKIEEGGLIPFEQDLDDYKGLSTSQKRCLRRRHRVNPVGLHLRGATTER